MSESLVTFRYYDVSKHNNYAMLSDDLIDEYNLSPLSHILVAIYPHIYLCRVIPSSNEIPCFGTLVTSKVIPADSTQFKPERATIIQNIDLPEITNVSLTVDATSSSYVPLLKHILAGVALTQGCYISVGGAYITSASSGIVRMNHHISITTRQTPIRLPIPLKKAVLDPYVGTSKNLDTLKKIIRAAIFEADNFSTTMLTPPNAALLIGPPGIGKSLLIETACNEMNVLCKTVTPGDIISDVPGEPHSRLNKIVSDAQSSPLPVVVVFDNIDILAPLRSDVNSAHSVTATLLTLFDGSSNQKICFFATTHDRYKIDPAVYRTGRIDHLIELSPPTELERQSIIENALSSSEIDFDYDSSIIAQKTAAYTGADLKSLVKKAIEVKSFESALKIVRPSLSRTSQRSLPDYTLEDFPGFEKVKDRITRAVHWPILREEKLLSLGLKPTTGVLITGPSGIGKTRLAICTAKDLGSRVNIFIVRGPELYGSYYGESERNLQKLYDQARRSAPSIVIIDDINAVVANRANDDTHDETGVRMLTTLLQLMDGVSSKPGVLTIATASDIDDIDEALIRPGRFDDIVEVSSMSENDICEVSQYYSSKFDIPLIDLSDLEDETIITPADIEFRYRSAYSDLQVLNKAISSTTV